MGALLEAQQKFFAAICSWGTIAYQRGYRCSFGDAYRDPRATFPYSSPRSYHGHRLAIDVNLFKDGVLIEGVEGWREMGELWESAAPEATWGGRWKNGDANHLSWGER